MKKITLLIALVLLVNINGLSGFAASSAQNVLGKIENSLYGFQYTGESDSARLDRIENQYTELRFLQSLLPRELRN